MRGRALNVLVVVFAVILAAIIFLSDRSISHFMEACGDFISQVFGF